MYHRFGPGEIDAATLDWQIAAVKAHHPFWSVARHLETVSSVRPIDEYCPVVVTVDDGYRDFRDVAYPVFRKHDVPVALFVTTGFVDGRLWMWWDRLAYVFQNAAAVSLSVDHAGERHWVDLTSAEQRLATWHRVGIRCCFLAEDLKLSLIQTLAQRLAVEIPDTPPARYASLTWENLRDLQGNGVDVGAHTVSHAILTRIPLAVARREISDSRRRLEEMLGVPVPYFCFPQGGPADYSAEVIEEVASAGFASAYLAFPSLSRSTSNFTLPRWSAPAERVEFLWVLSGAAYLDLFLHRLWRRDIGPGRAYWSGAEMDVRDPGQELKLTDTRVTSST
jgi:peptidoglycan/xylan/chitin deacetylase (PgdA/CDA1 family)